MGYRWENRMKYWYFGSGKVGGSLQSTKSTVFLSHSAVSELREGPDSFVLFNLLKIKQFCSDNYF